MSAGNAQAQVGAQMARSRQSRRRAAGSRGAVGHVCWRVGHTLGRRCAQACQQPDHQAHRAGLPPVARATARLAHGLGDAVEGDGQQHNARPPTVASPMSRRPMPRSTIWPRPPTAIMEAMTTMDNDSISDWLMPAMMEGMASGSCTLTSICQGRSAMGAGRSMRSGRTWRMPGWSAAPAEAARTRW